MIILFKVFEKFFENEGSYIYTCFFIQMSVLVRGRRCPMLQRLVWREGLRRQGERSTLRGCVVFAVAWELARPQVRRKFAPVVVQSALLRIWRSSTLPYCIYSVRTVMVLNILLALTSTSHRLSQQNWTSVLVKRLSFGLWEAKLNIFRIKTSVS